MSFFPLMKAHRFMILLLLLLIAVVTGDWLARQHNWWVFEVPSKTTSVLLQPPENNPLDTKSISSLGPVADLLSQDSFLTSLDFKFFSDRDTTQEDFIKRASEQSTSTSLQNTTEAGPLAVIHSKQILGLKDGEPTPADLEKLRHAMSAFGEQFNDPIIIIDADRRISEFSTAVLYAAPQHDVTHLVLEFFKRELSEVSLTKNQR